jgi:GTPase SAR1 family protein
MQFVINIINNNYLTLYNFEKHLNFIINPPIMQKDPLNKVKIDLIVIGNPNSGKTSLIKRFIDG